MIITATLGLGAVSIDGLAARISVHTDYISGKSALIAGIYVCDHFPYILIFVCNIKIHMRVFSFKYHE